MVPIGPPAREAQEIPVLRCAVVAASTNQPTIGARSVSAPLTEKALQSRPVPMSHNRGRLVDEQVTSADNSEEHLQVTAATGGGSDIQCWVETSKLQHSSATKSHVGP